MTSPAASVRDALRAYLEWLRADGQSYVRLSRTALTAWREQVVGASSAAAPIVSTKVQMVRETPPTQRAAASPVGAVQAAGIISSDSSSSPIMAREKKYLDASPAIAVEGATKQEKLRHLAERVAVCQKCPHLARTRTQTVFSSGNPETRLMLVGEAPGADEDRLGEPFVGAAGKLLTKMLAAMGLTRNDVYIANILKCRPDMPAGASGNRKPTTEEMATCLPYLKTQIDIIVPEVIVALGATAVEGLLGVKSPMNQMRGKFVQWRDIPLMPTYHPAYLLRNQRISEKRKVWEDLLRVMEQLKMPISKKQRDYFLTTVP